jgi:hypothetical protein
MLLYLPKAVSRPVEHALAALALVFKRSDVRRQHPCSAKASRSASVNAVPLLRRGFMSRPNRNAGRLEVSESQVFESRRSSR